MKEKVLKKFMQGFLQFHILYHAKAEPFYGTWMIAELKEHGYEVSPGTIYPVLHGMEESGLLSRSNQINDGKIRKYYDITELGMTVLYSVKDKIKEFIDEMEEKL